MPDTPRYSDRDLEPLRTALRALSEGDVSRRRPVAATPERPLALAKLLPRNLDDGQTGDRHGQAGRIDGACRAVGGEG